MRWFTNRFYKEGPGIPKDEPKKHGLALLWQIIRREYWELFKLNLFFILFSLPVITMPAAYAAATKISIEMIEDNNIYLFKDYVKYFRSLFWRSTIIGGLFAAALALGGYSTYIYAQLVSESIGYAAAATVCFAVTVILSLICLHIFVIIAGFDLNLIKSLKLAALATLAKPLPAIAGLVAIGFLWLMHILLYPISVFMPATFLFSFGPLFMAFAVLKTTHFVFDFSAVEGQVKKRTDNFAIVQKST